MLQTNQLSETGRSVQSRCSFADCNSTRHAVFLASQEQESRYLHLSELELCEGANTPPPDHLFRLFVGWVPQLFTEADLKPLFDQVRFAGLVVLAAVGRPHGAHFIGTIALLHGGGLCRLIMHYWAHTEGHVLPSGVSSTVCRPHVQWGDVKDIIVLKDKVTGQPRGCAFVSYATREEAEAAIQHLDRRVQLPGALSQLEVRFASACAQAACMCRRVACMLHA